MNIVRLTGGLGNQMFQYAFAKALEYKYSTNNNTDNSQIITLSQTQNKVLTSSQNKTNILLDLSAYNQKKEQNGINLVHNGFELDRIFNISFEKASLRDIKRLSTQPTSLFMRLRRKYFTKKTHFIDTTFSYNQEVLNFNNSSTKTDIYYDGYWQTERYFEEISNQIRKDFTFKLQLAEQNQKLLNDSANKKRASIHVRRGDYLNSPNLNVCTKQYYHNALTKLLELNMPDELWIFSDDIAWCKNELELEQVISKYLTNKNTLSNKNSSDYTSSDNNSSENNDFSISSTSSNNSDFSTSPTSSNNSDFSTPLTVSDNNEFSTPLTSSLNDLPKITYIDWNKAENSWQDMALMSNCSSHIIANSSFSWWGAWLDSSPNKIVIAPKPWNMRELHNNDSYYHHDYADIVPSSWLRVGIN